jgi:hypothetical protein
MICHRSYPSLKQGGKSVRLRDGLSRMDHIIGSDAVVRQQFHPGDDILYL